MFVTLTIIALGIVWVVASYALGFGALRCKRSDQKVDMTLLGYMVDELGGWKDW